MLTKVVENLVITVQADEYEFGYTSNLKRKKKIMKIIRHKGGKAKDIAFAELHRNGDTTLHFFPGIKITKSLKDLLNKLVKDGIKAVRAIIAPPQQQIPSYGNN